MPAASRIRCLARAVTAAGIAAVAYVPANRASSSETSALATDSGCGALRTVTGAFMRSSLLGLRLSGYLSGQACARRPAHVNGAHASAALGPQRNRIAEPIRRVQIERDFDDTVFGELVDALDLECR